MKSKIYQSINDLKTSVRNKIGEIPERQITRNFYNFLWTKKSWTFLVERKGHATMIPFHTCALIPYTPTVLCPRFSNQRGSGCHWSVIDAQLFPLTFAPLFYLFCGILLHFNEKGTVLYFPISLSENTEVNLQRCVMRGENASSFWPCFCAVGLYFGYEALALGGFLMHC